MGSLLHFVVVQWLLLFLSYACSKYENTLSAYLRSLCVFVCSDTLYIARSGPFSNLLTYFMEVDRLSCYAEFTVEYSPTTSPTSQLPCSCIASTLVQCISSSGHHFWRYGWVGQRCVGFSLGTLGALDKSVRQVPSFSLHLHHLLISHQFLLVQI